MDGCLAGKGSLAVTALGKADAREGPDSAGPGRTSASTAPGSARGEGIRVMTEAERELLRVIGARVAGPRHAMTLGADNATLERLDSLMAQGLVESTGYAVRNAGPVVRVRLTGRGWVRFKGGTKP